jgi:hypothetical protein
LDDCLNPDPDPVFSKTGFNPDIRTQTFTVKEKIEISSSLEKTPAIQQAFQNFKENSFFPRFWGTSLDFLDPYPLTQLNQDPNLFFNSIVRGKSFRNYIK